MEQGYSLDSTRMSVAQEGGPPTDHEPALDAAITGLLQAPTRATASKPVPEVQPQGDVADLADACIEQVARLEHWDANPGWLTKEQGDAEMDRWGAVFRRAIDQPSVDLRDLAGKAHLMLADLERFHPLEENSSDDARLMRVILAEAMRFGDLSGPTTFISDDPILALIEEGRRLLRISDALHTRPEAETAEAERAAEEKRRDALRALYAHCDDAVLKTVPLTAPGCRELARFGVEYFQSNGVPISDDEQAITRLIAQCPLNPEPSSRPGRGDHALWRAIDAYRKAEAALIDAAVAADCVRIRQEGGDTSAAAMAPLEAAALAAGLAEIQAWRDVFKVRPHTVNGLLALLRHTSEHHEENHGIDDAPDVFGTLIGVVEGLRFATRSRPSEHDLSLLSISELEHLAQIADRERQTLMAVESQGLCWQGDKEAYSPLGRIIEAEGERMCFLADHAVREIERRRPAEMREVNLRLEALVRHDLNCNGRITPDLMTEIVQTWGRV